jgi:hypothetical protein
VATVVVDVTSDVVDVVEVDAGVGVGVGVGVDAVAVGMEPAPVRKSDPHAVAPRSTVVRRASPSRRCLLGWPALVRAVR